MDTEYARRQMLTQQVRAWDVHELRILDVMSEVPRENFVQAGFRHLAFADTGIPIGHRQRMMAPIVEGRMLQSLEITAGDSVLEIGTGSAYITACLAKLAARVHSIDVFEDFVSAAAGKLQDLGVNNVELGCLDACNELPAGPYDVIAVTASLPRFEAQFVARIIAALRPGGRLFVVVGESPIQEARLVVRQDQSAWTSSVLFETRLDSLLNFPFRSKFRL